MLWSSLATGRGPAHDAARWPGWGRSRLHASWVTYVRCHDDIGWAVTDEDAAAVGWGGAAHRAVPQRLLLGQRSRARSPGRAVPAQRGDRRRPHLRARRRRCAGVESRPRPPATRPRSTWPSPGWSCCTRWPSPSAASPRLHGRRAGAAQRPLATSPIRPTGRQPLAAPAADGLVGGPSGATWPAPSRRGCSRAAAAGRRSGRAAPAPRRRPDHGRPALRSGGAVRPAQASPRAAPLGAGELLRPRGGGGPRSDLPAWASHPHRLAFAATAPCSTAPVCCCPPTATCG